MSAAPAPLLHPLLEARGIAHGFGVRGLGEPAGVVRPRQVHGRGVLVLDDPGAPPSGEADAIVSSVPHVPVAVVTADCVPVLVASADGRIVAAIHAGWRGLAAGVIAAAMEAFARLGGEAGHAVAAVGPHVNACCYEVDAPVVEALRARLGGALDAALRQSRPGHWRLDLGLAARLELERAGLPAAQVGGLPDACTACDARRFHSYRRDGPRAGRLLHFVCARGRS